MMTFQDYVEQVRADAEDAIAEGSAWHEGWEDMLDALYIDDAVTGNGSGSYTFSAARSLDNVRGYWATASSWRRPPHAVTVSSCSGNPRKASTS